MTPQAATFVGIRNGRPRFDFGDASPPRWLVDLIERARAEGNTLRLADGRVLNPGDQVHE